MIKKNKITAAVLLLGMAGSILTGSGSCIVKGAAEPEPLKVPHHGVYNTALQELFETVEPECAVICSSNKNPADPQTIELLKKYNVHVFQTKDGNITVISDGTSLEMKQELEH